MHQMFLLSVLFAMFQLFLLSSLCVNANENILTTVCLRGVNVFVVTCEECYLYKNAIL